jgi:hypothetical protein
MRRNLIVAVAVTGILAAVTLPSGGEENRAALAKALSEASLTLEQGLKASEQAGTPISGKYEINEEGALQLSVYTMKGEQFSEVIVDHKSGAIKKAEQITDPDDLKNAKEQSLAMANAKVSLEKAVEEATKANSGYRAVSVTPSLQAEKPVAEVTLMKAEDVKKVTEKLN